MNGVVVGSQKNNNNNINSNMKALTVNRSGRMYSQVMANVYMYKCHVGICMYVCLYEHNFIQV